MEISLSRENKEVMKVVRSTATVEEVNSGSGLDVDKKQDLQAAIGYEFHLGELLAKATTHPSLTTSAGSSKTFVLSAFGIPRYDGEASRQSFSMFTLNLAVSDLTVMCLLFQQYPDAMCGQLSAARSLSV